MKKLFALLMAVTVLASTSFGSFVTNTSQTTTNKASEMYIPLGNTGKQVSLAQLSTMNADELQQATGKKMNFLEKISFKVAQHKIKKMINKDGTVNMKALEKVMNVEDMTAGFNIGGFALGLLLSIIGVLIAYLIDGQGSSLVKWAWIGAAVNLALWLLVAIF